MTVVDSDIWRSNLTIHQNSINTLKGISTKVVVNIAINVALKSHANSWLQYGHPGYVEICVC